jgi:sugar (pentulose or hexulose) kinase
MQILADVLQRPVSVTDNEPACAIGAAILAAWGGGLYSCPEAAVAAMCKAPGKTYLPDPTANYEARYRRYREAADGMAAL